MTKRTSRRFLSAVLLAAVTYPLAAGDWSRFRGPNGAGVAETSGLPAEFGPDKNVVWKTPLPMGKSSPALAEGRIFLTAHENEKLYTICLDRDSGKILWRREAPSRRLEKKHRLNDEASSSPVTDGENVYTFLAGMGCSRTARTATNAGGSRWVRLLISMAWGRRRFSPTASC